ncbi:hypothetical protein E8E15_009290 [Penicillium rubens]|nr:hypothetical protein E8E15_009290 [Penicillium rubens]
MNAYDRADEERMFGALPRYTTSCERSFSYCHFFKHLVTGDLLKKGYSRAYTQGFKAEGEVEVVFQEMKLVGCEALLLMAFSSFQPYKGATGAAKFVTSTLGNTLGGVTRTVGGVAGTAGRGVGDTITSATGSAGEPIGNALSNVSSGLENGAKRVAQGTEDAGKWK